MRKEGGRRKEEGGFREAGVTQEAGISAFFVRVFLCVPWTVLYCYEAASCRVLPPYSFVRLPCFIPYSFVRLPLLEERSSMAENTHSFAYLFERFPSFVQTFVYREAEEMVRQKVNPLLVSVREPEDAEELRHKTGTDVVYLPSEKALRAEIEERRHTFSSAQRRALSHWRSLPDSGRIFEALWLGQKLKEKGIRHVHAHFGALAARTAWHLQQLWGIGYSFTGHANDIFCETDFPVSNSKIANGARFIVTETDFARQWMEQKHPSTKGHVFRVFNGIRLDEFPAHVETPGVPCIVSVGRYVEKKGFPDLIAACALLRDRGVEFQCSIIGDGPMREELTGLIAEKNLQQSVILTGPRAQDDVRQCIAAAHLSVLACRRDKDGGSDNLPTVIMEAMACGTPVVSTRVAGVPEMIDDGLNGLLLNEGDVAGLAAAMERLLKDKSLAQEMGAKALKAAHEKFAIENSVARLLELLVTYGRVQLPSDFLRDHPHLRLPWWKRLLGF